MSTDRPLVSCIMPTRNRTRFVAKAVDYFLRQDYPNKELIIFEEETRSLEKFPPGVIYRHTPFQIYNSIGAKRNAMCKYACTKLIAHWDDDDWHAPNRLSMQIDKMLSEGSSLCGADRLVFYNGEQAWLFQTMRKPWLAGGTLVYERKLWQEQPFQEVSNGEDVSFIDMAYRRAVKASVINDPSLYVAMLHDANTTRREPDAQWGGFDVEQVRSWMSQKGPSDARA